MKYLLFILVSFLFITACEKSERFASLSEDSSLVESSEKSAPKYEEDIKALVVEDVEVKISDKKRQAVDVIDTVGENNLRPARRAVTHIDITSRVLVTDRQESAEVSAENSSKADVSSAAQVKQEQTTVIERTVQTTTKAQRGGHSVNLGPKLNILVYLNSRSYGACVDRLRRNHSVFIEGLSSYNWELGFAYYASADEVELMPLEYVNGIPYDADRGFFDYENDYTLSKGEYSDEKTKRLFFTTLEPAVPPHNQARSANPTPGTPNTNRKPATDPLSGLDQLLSSQTGKEAPTVVLFFGDAFPYYSTSEWNQFYGQHPNVSLIALSHRSGNVSNFLHILEKASYDFSFVPGCGGNIKSVLDIIGRKVN